MAITRSLQTFSCLCMSLFLLSPTEAFNPRPMRTPTITDMLAASLIGVILSGAHHHAKLQKMQEEEDNQISAQHQQPVYLPVPWQTPFPQPQQHPMPRHPLQHNILPLVPPMPPFLQHHPQMRQMPLMPFPEPLPAWIHQQVLAQLQPFQNPGLPRFGQMDQMPPMHWHHIPQPHPLFQGLDISGHLMNHNIMPRQKCNMHSK